MANLDIDGVYFILDLHDPCKFADEPEVIVSQLVHLLRQKLRLGAYVFRETSGPLFGVKVRGVLDIFERTNHHISKQRHDLYLLQK